MRVGVISGELGREMFMTTSFFKQEFRAKVPETIYFLGNNRLADILRDNPMPGAPSDLRFGLPDLPVSGIGLDRANEIIHLLSNLYLPEDFSFLPQDMVEGRKSEFGYKLAVAALVFLIVVAGALGFSLNTKKRSLLADYDRMAKDLEKQQKVVRTLSADVSRLMPFKGWKEYVETVEHRLPWNKAFSRLALLVPENLIIEEFKMDAAGIGKSSGEIKGKIRASDWEHGLQVVREFGQRLQESPVFKVTNVQYTPEGPKGLQNLEKEFEFKMTLNLLPMEKAKTNES